VKQIAVPVKIRIMAFGVDGDHQIAEILVKELQRFDPGTGSAGQVHLVVSLVIPAKIPESLKGRVIHGIDQTEPAGVSSIPAEVLSKMGKPSSCSRFFMALLRFGWDRNRFFAALDAEPHRAISRTY